MKNHAITITLTLSLLLTACSFGAVPPTATSLPTTPTQPLPEPTFTPTASPVPTFTPTASPAPTFTPTPISEGWVLIKTTHSPSPRTGHAMTMLPDGRVLLFGGVDADGNVLDDTWVFDGGTTAGLPLGRAPGLMSLVTRPLWEDWNNIDPSNPPEARYGSTMTNVNGHIILWGGEDGTNPFNDTYEFRDGEWQKVTPANNPPPPRSDQRSWAYDHKMYIQGGIGAKDANGNMTLYNDLWVYSPAANTWSQLADPPDFISPYANPFITSTTAILNDPHSATSWNPGKSYDYDMANDRWHEVHMKGLPTDGEHGGYGLVQVDDKHAIMFGGYIWNPDTQEKLPTAEVWLAEWHPESQTFTWKRLENMPFPLGDARAVFDPFHNRIIVFGGKDPEANKYFNQLLLYFIPDLNSIK